MWFQRETLGRLPRHDQQPTSCAHPKVHGHRHGSSLEATGAGRGAGDLRVPAPGAEPPA